MSAEQLAQIKWFMAVLSAALHDWVVTSWRRWEGNHSWQRFVAEVHELGADQ